MEHLSRLLLRYEWKLHPRIFQQLDSMWGPHTINCFASMLTAQLPTYNSLFLDPLTSQVDAQQLGQPPFRLLNHSNLTSKPRSYSHSDCPQVVLSSVVREVKEDEHLYPNSSSQCVGGFQMPCWGAIAMKEQDLVLEDLCLEIMWKQRLLNLR